MCDKELTRRLHREKTKRIIAELKAERERQRRLVIEALLDSNTEEMFNAMMAGNLITDADEQFVISTRSVEEKNGHEPPRTPTPPHLLASAEEAKHVGRRPYFEKMMARIDEEIQLAIEHQGRQEKKRKSKYDPPEHLSKQWAILNAGPAERDQLLEQISNDIRKSQRIPTNHKAFEKIVFLYPDLVDQSRFHLEPDHLQSSHRRNVFGVNRIVHETGAKVVLLSGIIPNEISEFSDSIRNIVGRTIPFVFAEQTDTITEWLNHNHATSYAILTDESDIIFKHILKQQNPSLKEHSVITSWRDGLSLKEGDTVIDLLNKQR